MSLYIYILGNICVCMTDFEFSFFYYPTTPSPFSFCNLSFGISSFTETWGAFFFLLSFSPIGQKWDYFIGSLDSVMGWRKRYFRPGSIWNVCLDLVGIVRWSNTAALTERKSNQWSLLWSTEPSRRIKSFGSTLQEDIESLFASADKTLLTSRGPEASHKESV